MVGGRYNRFDFGFWNICGSATDVVAGFAEQFVWGDSLADETAWKRINNILATKGETTIRF
jgi:hypothetical protein